MIVSFDIQFVRFCDRVSSSSLDQAFLLIGMNTLVKSICDPIPFPFSFEGSSLVDRVGWKLETLIGPGSIHFRVINFGRKIHAYLFFFCIYFCISNNKINYIMEKNHFFFCTWEVTYVIEIILALNTHVSISSWCAGLVFTYSNRILFKKNHMIVKKKVSY